MGDLRKEFAMLNEKFVRALFLNHRALNNADPSFQLRRSA